MAQHCTKCDGFFCVSYIMEYEKEVINKEENVLEYYKQVTKDDSQQQTLFIDLTFRQILTNTSFVFVSIINDILSAKTFSDFIMAFLKEGRMIYIGLIILFIAFAIYIIDISQ